MFTTGTRTTKPEKYVISSSACAHDKNVTSKILNGRSFFLGEKERSKREVVGGGLFSFRVLRRKGQTTVVRSEKV